MRHTTARFGWLPDLPDQRDYRYAAPKPYQKLDKKVDLTQLCPPAYDKGQLGSCTANAIGSAIELGLMKQKRTSAFMPARLFIYYNERVIEHSVNSDSGRMIRDGIKSIHQGVCPETLWGYNINRFAEKPVPPCYAEALGRFPIIG